MKSRHITMATVVPLMATILTSIHTKRLFSAFLALSLTFIALTLTTYYFISGNTRGKPMPMSGQSIRSQELQAFDVFEDKSLNRISRVQTYCNPFTTLGLNEELVDISAVIPDFRLSQVFVLIRHGDRGPLRLVRNMSSISCDPFIAFKSTNFHHLFKNFFAQSKDKIKYSSKIFAKTPKSGCELGGLTRYGCVQHLILGSLLGQTYVNKLNLKPKKVKALTTPYSRTYQSALAFIYGFLRPKSVIQFNDFPPIVTTFGTYFCSTSEFCLRKCKKLDVLQKTLNENKRQILSSHPAVVRLLDDLKSIIAHNSNESHLFESPLALMDGLMAYMCHNNALPCNDKRCVTTEDVKELMAFIDFHGKQLAVNQVFKHINWLKIYGFLSTISKTMASNESNEPFILYSGHDITIVSLASALDFFDGSIPPYASRVIFETYKHQSMNSSYVRIIYNGKDVTRLTEICKLNPSKCLISATDSKQDIHLIDVKVFNEFIANKFKSFTKTSVYQNACNV